MMRGKLCSGGIDAETLNEEPRISSFCQNLHTSNTRHASARSIVEMCVRKDIIHLSQKELLYRMYLPLSKSTQTYRCRPERADLDNWMTHQVLLIYPCLLTLYLTFKTTYLEQRISPP